MRSSGFIIAALTCTGTMSHSSITVAAESSASSTPSRTSTIYKKSSMPATDKFRRNTVPNKSLSKRRVLMETSAFGFSHAFIIFRSWLITLLAIRVAVLFSVSTWRQVKKALREMDDADFRMPCVHIEVKSKNGESVSTMSSQTSISEQDSMNSFLKKLTNGDDPSVSSLPLSSRGPRRNRVHVIKPHSAPSNTKKFTKKKFQSGSDEDSMESLMKKLDSDESTVDTQPITSSDNTSHKGRRRHNPDKVLGEKNSNNQNGLSKAKINDILAQYGLNDDSSESGESQESEESGRGKRSTLLRRKASKKESSKTDVSFGSDDSEDDSKCSRDLDEMLFSTLKA
mmetsp:Transcript_23207/g.48202  ORF Transcript_23207/g.48202 Transcript_23207/m.48202 type:complete len:341 (+) Transcript_23207:225-1247(+)